MTPEKKLGRGLDFLLSQVAREESAEELLHVSVGQLRPNRFQPRKDFSEEELQGLVESIRNHGILQPLIARRSEAGFELIAGERRWRAAQKAQLPVVPVILKEVTDDQLLAMAMVENLQRADLNPIEKAKAARQLMDLTRSTQEDVAQRLGISRPSLANFLRLLDLPKEVQEHVSRGTLSMGHARALLGLQDSARILPMALECARLSWSVREAEERVREANTAPPQPPSGRKPSRSLPAWHRELEERLTHALRNRVVVKFSRKKARILIETPDRESFDHLFDRLIALPEATLEEGESATDTLLL